MDKQDSEKKKFNTKGMSKRQNNLEAFQSSAQRSIDNAENRRFCMVCSGGANRMVTYEQQNLGLSAYYDKCCRMGYTLQIRFSRTQHEQAAAVYLAGQPTALRGRTPVSGHRANNR